MITPNNRDYNVTFRNIIPDNLFEATFSQIQTKYRTSKSLVLVNGTDGLQNETVVTRTKYFGRTENANIIGKNQSEHFGHFRKIDILRKHGNGRVGPKNLGWFLSGWLYFCIRVLMPKSRENGDAFWIKNINLDDRNMGYIKSKHLFKLSTKKIRFRKSTFELMGVNIFYGLLNLLYF